MRDDLKKPITRHDLYWFAVLGCIFLLASYFSIRVLGIRNKGFVGVVIILMAPILKFDRLIRKKLGWVNTYEEKEITTENSQRSLRGVKYFVVWMVFMVGWVTSFNSFFAQMNRDNGEWLFLLHMALFLGVPCLLFIIFLFTKPKGQPNTR
jgi:hypothetical protein